MAIRNTRLVIKNNSVPNAPFSGATLLKGEAIVNTADGIMMFSGVTSSTSEWTPAGTGVNANFFEVGSNLNNLKIRNKITAYSGLTNLSGKFLSGTTNGFELADITSISGVDTYVTGFTYDNNVITIKQNQGQPNLSVLINTVSGLTINGNLTVTGNTNLSGSTYLYTPVNGSNPYSVINLDYLTGYSISNDVYVTGSTLTPSNNNTNVQTSQLSYHGSPIGGPYTITTNDTFTTGGTYNNTNKLITFKRNDGSTGYTVDLNSIDVNDTYVTGGTISTYPSNNNINGIITLSYNNPEIGTYTLPYSDVYTSGFTYNSSNNTLSIKDNSGNTLNSQITSVSGLSFNNLTSGRVVYVGSGGLLTDEAGFTYDSGTNTFSVPTDGTVNVGTGGLNVTGNAVIQGSLTVFGASISAFTSELYVEDNNVILNYNPTGSTTTTSLGSGISIQDGSGISNTATTFNIGLSYGNSNLNPNTEYTSSTGNSNRNFYTQVGDIIIRNTNNDPNQPDGVRLLGEGDTLDGGTY